MSAPRSSAFGPRNSGVLARRIGGSFALVVVVATMLCGALLFFLGDVASTVIAMQHDEHAMHHSLDVAMAVREQYIHAAHMVIDGDQGHLPRYQEWVDRARAGTSALALFVPPEERRRVERIERLSRAADEQFRASVLPAVRAGDLPRARAAYLGMDQSMSAAATEADHIAAIAANQMSRYHVDATREAYLGGGLAVGGILLLVGLAVASTRKLREAVVRPLGALASAAQRIGSGDFQTRVGLNAEGELGVVGRAFDRMAEELSEHQRRLIANERMAAIGQLAAGVAHEINNPIGVIRGYLRTMLPETEPGEHRDELRILDEEAAACQRIADDLLAYARSPELVTAEMDVAELLRQTAERFETSGESNGRRIVVRADSGQASIDAQRLRQVLQNLLRNATQASPPGSEIDLEGSAAAEGYSIRVLDRGAGIPAEIQAKIFEPFISGRSGGSGLGLAVCDGIVRAHGGRIEAKPRDGGGTEFIITLEKRASSDG